MPVQISGPSRLCVQKTAAEITPIASSQTEENQMAAIPPFSDAFCPSSLPPRRTPRVMASAMDTWHKAMTEKNVANGCKYGTELECLVFLGKALSKHDYGLRSFLLLQMMAASFPDSRKAFRVRKWLNRDYLNLFQHYSVA